MAFLELHYNSPALGMQTACNVILPELPGQTGPFPVFYLLHGLSDDHTIWQRRTSIGRYVQMLPMIVVMPAGGRGFYCDAKEGFAYETALISDLVGYIDRMFNTRAEKSGRCVGGLSMGGYGAIKLALKFPEMFCSANGHSGAYGFAHAGWRGSDPEFARILGEDPAGGPDDCYALASQFGHGEHQGLLPGLRIDCGASDFLLEDNRDFHQHLTALNIPHEYAEYPGAHDWSYWDKHVQTAIRFHAANLGISKPRIRANRA